ncbi:MAG: mannose-1-phosphate guanylyltransferase [Bacteroidia bacterium]|nr:sugar phosphate nucleotidyltransferase [Bacteroidia bacterium]MDW8334166.1 mannose-1-phosphate guanylyltransferase [Bacteroidia bacterium]
MSQRFALVMAGGVGTRFWPLSRTRRPKQFLDVTGKAGKSLLQTTVERLEGVIAHENVYIATNAAYVDLVLKQLPSMTKERVLAEPVMRNTAPCIALATFKLVKTAGEDAVLVILPADHYIEEADDYRRVLERGMEAAAHCDDVITIGIKPTRPDTGYGYIQYHEQADAWGCHKVKTFVEKPHLALAEQFLLSGDFVWNAGIFIASLRTLRNAFRTFMPDLYEALAAVQKHFNTRTEARILASVYAGLRSISFDYGVMEKNPNVRLIPAVWHWSDLGTWEAAYSYQDKDFLGNATGGANALVLDGENNIVRLAGKHAEKKVVALKGVSGLIVVDTDDALLICPRGGEQSVRDVVEEVKKHFGSEYV